MVRRFFSYYRPYKGLFYLDFSCAVIAGLLELGFPLAVNLFVDRLLPSKDWSLILWACIGLLAVYALNTALQYIVTYWGHMLGVNIETDMRKKLFEHLVLFLASHASSHITGTEIFIDGAESLL